MALRWPETHQAASSIRRGTSLTGTDAQRWSAKGVLARITTPFVPQGRATQSAVEPRTASSFISTCCFSSPLALSAAI